MAGAVRRLTSVTKRENSSAGNNAGEFVADDNGASIAASGISGGVIDPDCAAEPDRGDAIDPDAPYGRKADGTARKRRGRQPGQATGERKSRSSKAKGSLGIEGLASILTNLTVMIGAASHIPEAIVSIEEATLISAAAENVAQYYDWSVDSKAVAWANLAMVVGGIAGAHVVAYKIRREGERERRAA